MLYSGITDTTCTPTTSSSTYSRSSWNYMYRTIRAPPISRPRTETVSGQKRAQAQNRAPGLELVHDLCVRARSLDTFPHDVERALDKIPLKKQVP